MTLCLGMMLLSSLFAPFAIRWFIIRFFIPCSYLVCSLLFAIQRFFIRSFVRVLHKFPVIWTGYYGSLNAGWVSSIAPSWQRERVISCWRWTGLPSVCHGQCLGINTLIRYPRWQFNGSGWQCWQPTGKMQQKRLPLMLQILAATLQLYTAHKLLYSLYRVNLFSFLSI